VDRVKSITSGNKQKKGGVNKKRKGGKRQHNGGNFVGGKRFTKKVVKVAKQHPQEKKKSLLRGEGKV